MRDGLGFEELGDSEDSAQKDAQLNITGSVTAGGQISGLNLFAAGSLVAGRLNDGNGALLPVSVGSPASFGAFAQAGSVSTAAGSGATLEFGQQFNTAVYYVQLTAAADNSGVAPYVSGALNVSGCEVVGEASTAYNYIAVGL